MQSRAADPGLRHLHSDGPVGERETASAVLAASVKICIDMKMASKLQAPQPRGLCDLCLGMSITAHRVTESFILDFVCGLHGDVQVVSGVCLGQEIGIRKGSIKYSLWQKQPMHG